MNWHNDHHVIIALESHCCLGLRSLGRLIHTSSRGISVELTMLKFAVGVFGRTGFKVNGEQKPQLQVSYVVCCMLYVCFLFLIYRGVC